MSSSEKKTGSGLKNYIFALTLLLAANIIMSTSLISLSQKTLREQINQRMLDVTNTAAYMINGDELKTLTINDKNTEIYNDVYNVLDAFQDNIQLEYIYGVKPEEDGTFTFTIDPSDDSGQFGSPVVTTDALVNASKGFPDVDKTPYTDRWGTFYSSYSPVFDSNGKVVGVIVADFKAEWYDDTVNSNRTMAVVITIITFFVGVILSSRIINRNRKSFTETLKKLEELDHETQKLDRLIMKTSIKKLDFLPSSESSVLKTLASGETDKKQLRATDYSDIYASIETVYKNLKMYMQYVENDVYTDDFTGVKNKAAYKRRVSQYEEDIASGTASFSIGFFDINDMKTVYTNYGYEAGDKLMYDCARLLKETFGDDNVFHIVGDEYIVLMDKASEDDVKKLFAQLDEKIKAYNSDSSTKHTLTITRGSMTYDPKKHKDYRQVFIETKKAYDKDKERFRNKTNSNK